MSYSLRQSQTRVENNLAFDVMLPVRALESFWKPCVPNTAPFELRGRDQTGTFCSAYVEKSNEE